MKRILFACWLIGNVLLSGIAVGQQITVYGEVKGEGGQQPLAGAVVFVENTRKQITTDDEGKFHIMLKPGRYNIGAFAFGYKTVLQSIQLKDKKHNLTFVLPELRDSLEMVEVQAERAETFGITRLRSVEGMAIYEGKKSEVVVLDDITANLATNNSRQVYAKVAGLNIWESDGAGLQLGIGGRGLNPNRTSHFNTRQNGYDISADALGYPESYYTPPTQALERIEVVRGAASLQYGTQFGGMLNFVMKKGPKDKKIELTSEQTMGSFGLFNSFNSVGGTVGKVNYYTYFHYKQSDGWRPNTQLEQYNVFSSLKYNLSDKWTLGLDFTHMNYLAQQPGGLTDQQFESDPQQSRRNRNWFKVNWNLLALTLDYKLSPNTKINSRFFGLSASREALGNLSRIDREDEPGTNRNLISGVFQNIGNETRLMHYYNLRGHKSVFLIGTRFYKGFSNQQQGEGNALEGADFHFENPDWLMSDYDFPSGNISVFAENIFNLTPKFSITPGIRFEYLSTNAEGFYRIVNRNLADEIIYDEEVAEDRSNQRSFVFFGLGLSYKKSEQLEFYANASQNYRSVNFSDIRIDNPNLVVDPDLGDVRGLSTDIGVRGGVNDYLSFDVSVFHLYLYDWIARIRERVSDVKEQIRSGNIGDIRAYGVEAYAETELVRLFTGKSLPNRLYWFTNVSLINASYTDSEIRQVVGNKVENAPEVNLKTGLTFKRKNFSATYQLTYLSQQYSNANNDKTEITSTAGEIPAYYVMDLSLRYTYKWLKLESGVNNLTDNMYFTRRATGYPGPGIIPSDGRSLYMTLGVKI
ncbi:TonB-dependent receptor [Rapidithrix thailandica]|uniref:TonB-dependent receptor n=1 Tax=Rapidithrix thailandica TaxID=413964 RepID=A0AAW9S3C6_9BACT